MPAAAPLRPARRARSASTTNGYSRRRSGIGQSGGGVESFVPLRPSSTLNKTGSLDNRSLTVPRMSADDYRAAGAPHAPFLRPSCDHAAGPEVQGLAGWAGKPFHPPLDRLPDRARTSSRPCSTSISVIGGDDRTWAARCGTRAPSCSSAAPSSRCFAALTGLFDWLRSSEAGTQARRTANTHATIMLTVTVLALVDIALRLNGYHTAPSTPVADHDPLGRHRRRSSRWGATYGGTLVFDYGFNVETAGDSPVWHESETDVFPGSEVTRDDDSTLATARRHRPIRSIHARRSTSPPRRQRLAICSPRWAPISMRPAWPTRRAASRPRMRSC